MVAIPSEFPVTKPVLSTLATVGFNDSHGKVAAAVAEPVSFEVDPIHALNVPEIVGKALTVKVIGLVYPMLFL